MKSSASSCSSTAWPATSPVGSRLCITWNFRNVALYWLGDVLYLAGGVARVGQLLEGPPPMSEAPGLTIDPIVPSRQ